MEGTTDLQEVAEASDGVRQSSREAVIVTNVKLTVPQHAQKTAAATGQLSHDALQTAHTLPANHPRKVLGQRVPYMS